MSKTYTLSLTIPDELPTAYYEFFRDKGILQNFIDLGKVTADVSPDDLLLQVMEHELEVAQRAKSEQFLQYKASIAAAALLHPTIEGDVTTS